MYFLALCIEKDKKPTNSGAISTSSLKTVVFKYHFALKGTRALGEMKNFRSETGHVQDHSRNLKPASKEAMKDYSGHIERTCALIRGSHLPKMIQLSIRENNSCN